MQSAGRLDASRPSASRCSMTTPPSCAAKATSGMPCERWDIGIPFRRLQGNEFASGNDEEENTEAEERGDPRLLDEAEHCCDSEGDEGQEGEQVVRVHLDLLLVRGWARGMPMRRRLPPLGWWK